MMALLWKEWRENRGLVAGLALAAPALAWALSAVDGADVWFVPGMLALFVLAIGADLVAGDAGSGRIALLAVQPVRTGTIWGAKAIFFGVTAALYLGWLVAIEPAPFVKPRAAEVLLALLPGILALGAATVFFSTLIDRGFSAAAGAVAFLGVVGGAVVATWVETYHPKGDLTGAGAAAGLVVTAAFLAASFASFTLGRIWTEAKLRRVAIGFGALALLLVPPTAGVKAAMDGYLRIDPADPDLAVTWAYVPPEGGWAFLQAKRREPGPLGVPSPRTLYAVGIDDGRVRDVGRYGWPRSFEGAGRVQLYREEEVEKGKRLTIVTDYDLEAGTPLTTRPIVPEKRKKQPVPKIHRYWYRGEPVGDWGIRVYCGGKGCGVYHIARDEIIPLPCRVWSLPDTPDGDGLAVWKRGLWRVPLDGTDPVRIHAGAVSHEWLGRDHGIVIASGRALLLTRGTTEITPVGPEGERIVSTYLAADDAYLLLTEDKAWRGRPGDADVTPFPRPGADAEVGWFDGKSAIWVMPGEARYVTADGASRRLLPAEAK